MKISRHIPAAALFVCCTAIADAYAQNLPPVLVDISACMNLPVNAERYACYDKLERVVRAAQSGMPQISAEPAPAEVAPLPAAPAPAAIVPPAADVNPNSAVAGFGQETPSAADAKVVANEEGDKELHDTITDLDERVPGRWLITLASGQVWYMSNSQRFRLVKGMTVRIYPSPLRGSYRLARDDGKETGFVQVERVQ